MSHADVGAIIEGAIGTPGRLRALIAAETEEGAAIRAHLADCDECRSEADAWQAVDEALVAVTPDTMTAPTAAKARILGNVLATGVARGPDLVLGTAARGSAAGLAGSAPPPGPARPRVARRGSAAGPRVLARPLGSTPASGAAAAAEPPAAGRVWRTPGGAPMPSPMPAPVPMAGTPEPPVAPVAAPAACAHRVPPPLPAPPPPSSRPLRHPRGAGCASCPAARRAMGSASGCSSRSPPPRSSCSPWVPRWVGRWA